MHECSGSSPNRGADASSGRRCPARRASASFGCAKVCEYGEDAPVRVGVRFQPELAEDLLDVCLDSSLADEESYGECSVRQAFCPQAEYLALARGQVGEQVVAPPAAEESRDDRRVD